MRPLFRPRRWPVAEITSTVALAAQLELSDGQLAWLADVRSLERTVADEKLRNYRYRAVPRRGGLPARHRGAQSAAQGDPAVGAPRDP